MSQRDILKLFVVHSYKKAENFGFIIFMPDETMPYRREWNNVDLQELRPYCFLLKFNTYVMYVTKGRYFFELMKILEISYNWWAPENTNVCYGTLCHKCVLLLPLLKYFWKYLKISIPHTIHYGFFKYLNVFSTFYEGNAYFWWKNYHHIFEIWSEII